MKNSNTLTIIPSFKVRGKENIVSKLVLVAFVIFVATGCKKFFGN